MAYGYGYGGYPAPGGYYPPPPMPDQLAQLRQNQMQQSMIGQQVQNSVPAQNQQAQVAPPASNGILWVQGEEGAKAWLVAPGNTVMLMDSDGCSFYLKSADASGMPQPLRIFDYVERTSKTPANQAQSLNSPMVEYVTRTDFDALAARAAEMERELEQLKAKKATTQKKTTREDSE